jgi:membrane protease YdiL (CAAX protease family)
MGDQPEPFHNEHVPAAHPATLFVPIARPIYPVPDRQPSRKAVDLLLLGATRPRVWADLALWLAGMVLVECVATLWVILATDFPAGLPDDMAESARWEYSRILVPSMLVLRATGSLMVIAAILALGRQPIRSVGLTVRGFALDLPVGVGSMILATFLMIVVLTVLGLMWPSIRQQMEENAERLTQVIPRLRPLGFVGMALLIGFYEELVFRGFLMTRLRRVTGSWFWAIVLSTAAFTGLHAVDQTWTALIAVSILSIVFSVVTIWRRSIMPAIVGHALFDLFQFLWLGLQMGDSWT